MGFRPVCIELNTNCNQSRDSMDHFVLHQSINVHNSVKNTSCMFYLKTLDQLLVRVLLTKMETQHGFTQDAQVDMKTSSPTGSYGG